MKWLDALELAIQSLFELLETVTHTLLREWCITVSRDTRVTVLVVMFTMAAAAALSDFVLASLPFLCLALDILVLLR